MVIFVTSFVLLYNGLLRQCTCWCILLCSLFEMHCLSVYEVLLWRICEHVRSNGLLFCWQLLNISGAFLSCLWNSQLLLEKLYFNSVFMFSMDFKPSGTGLFQVLLEKSVDFFPKSSAWIYRFDCQTSLLPSATTFIYMYL